MLEHTPFLKFPLRSEGFIVQEVVPKRAQDRSFSAKATFGHQGWTASLDQFLPGTLARRSALKQWIPCIAKQSDVQASATR